MNQPVPRGTHHQAQAMAAAAIENRPGARESLLHQLYPLLSHTVHRYPKVFPTREDALQEGRLIILQSLYTFRESTGVPFLAYVRQRLHHHFLNQARKRQEHLLLNGAEQPQSRISGEEAAEPWINQLPDTDPLPEEQLITEELHTWLQEAVDSLSEDQKSLFHQHYGQGQTLRQIAAETGCHPVTLSRHKAVLLTRLREQLKE